MNRIIITTFDQLKQLMSEYVAANVKDKEVNDENVLWFIAMQEAKILFDSCSTKDIAGMLLLGTPPIDKEYVDGWLDTLFFDINYQMREQGTQIDEFDNEEFPNFDMMFASFYGVHDPEFGGDDE